MPTMAVRSMNPPVSKPPLITPSASPPQSRSFFPQPYKIPDAPPHKRQRLASTPRPFQPHRSSSSSTSLDQSVNFDKAREDSTLRMLDVWSHLADRYTRRLDEDDIIDLRRGEIIKDRGVVRGASKKWSLGCFADADQPDSESVAGEGEGDDDTDELDEGLEGEEIDDDDLVAGRIVPPVREMDPADAEDLREFLEAERKRREMCGNEAEEDSEHSAEDLNGYGRAESSPISHTLEPPEYDTETAEDEDDIPSYNASHVHSQSQALPTDSGSDDELDNWDVDEASMVYSVNKKSAKVNHNDLEEGDTSDDPIVILSSPISVSKPELPAPDDDHINNIPNPPTPVSPKRMPPGTKKRKRIVSNSDLPVGTDIGGSNSNSPVASSSRIKIGPVRQYVGQKRTNAVFSSSKKVITNKATDTTVTTKLVSGSRDKRSKSRAPKALSPSSAEECTRPVEVMRHDTNLSVNTLQTSSRRRSKSTGAVRLSSDESQETRGSPSEDDLNRNPIRTSARSKSKSAYPTSDSDSTLGFFDEDDRYNRSQSRISSLPSSDDPYYPYSRPPYTPGHPHQPPHMIGPLPDPRAQYIITQAMHQLSALVGGAWTPPPPRSHAPLPYTPPIQRHYRGESSSIYPPYHPQQYSYPYNPNFSSGTLPPSSPEIPSSPITSGTGRDKSLTKRSQSRGRRVSFRIEHETEDIVTIDSSPAKSRVTESGHERQLERRDIIDFSVDAMRLGKAKGKARAETFVLDPGSEAIVRGRPLARRAQTPGPPTHTEPSRSPSTMTNKAARKSRSQVNGSLSNG